MPSVTNQWLRSEFNGRQAAAGSLLSLRLASRVTASLRRRSATLLTTHRLAGYRLAKPENRELR
eukprot:scaffold362947_cov17-Prasinocladus_malaysianus.AAC.1